MSKEKPYANPVRKAKFKDGEQTAFLVPVAKVLAGVATAGIGAYGYEAYKGVERVLRNVKEHKKKNKKKKTPKE